MARIIAAAMTALLLFAVVPAAFGDELGETAPLCANPDGLDVLTADGLTADLAAPSFTEDAPESTRFLVDLGAEDLTAPVDVTLRWEVADNDFDLQAATADETVVSEHTQPLEEAAELANLSAVGQCDVVTVTATNFLAPAADTLTLEISLGDVTDEVVPAAPAAADLNADLEALEDFSFE